MIALTVDEFKSLTRSNPDVNIVDCYYKVIIVDNYGQEMATLTNHRAYY